LDQLKSRGYADKYRNTGRKIILAGVNFSSEKREVDEFSVEAVQSA
ncbi:MAG TPA: hypothetical protein ENJ20_05980, partial [Bacteroidetes bacterium]|nr:hypothetical protein [Bacteroidota bacterium]